jgi:hypothetical protein
VLGGVIINIILLSIYILTLFYMSKPSELAAWTHRKKHKPKKDDTWTVPTTGNNPPNGPTVLRELTALQKSSDGKGKRKGWGLLAGGKTKKNKNRKTKRYTKRYISKLNKRNKTRKRRNSH